jgi:hypothetical protein
MNGGRRGEIGAKLPPPHICIRVRRKLDGLETGQSIRDADQALSEPGRDSYLSPEQRFKAEGSLQRGLTMPQSASEAAADFVDRNDQFDRINLVPDDSHTAGSVWSTVYATPNHETL